MKVLVTSGATREPIDSVRFITNFSTGATGARLAEAFAAEGHEVRLLAGEGAEVPSSPACEITRFGDFADLDSKIGAFVSGGKVDLVVHLAAVGDYSVASVEDEAGGRLAREGKIDSSRGLVLRLKRNPKIVAGLRARAGAATRVVAFKLTDTKDEAERLSAVRRLAECDLDLVVHNDLGEMREGLRRFRVFDRKFGEVGRADGVDRLASLLMEISRP